MSFGGRGDGAGSGFSVGGSGWGSSGGVFPGGLGLNPGLSLFHKTLIFFPPDVHVSFRAVCGLDALLYMRHHEKASGNKISFRLNILGLPLVWLFTPDELV